MRQVTADVLVIDDSDIVRTGMVRAIEGSGLRVVDLPSPIGATATILRAGVRLVVIDVNMPTMNGDKLAALFRKSERLQHLRIVLVSGTDADQLDRLAKEVRADAVVPKSEGNAALVRTVTKLLAEKT